MSERPIIFSDPMVRAIMDGQKTQTRRVLKLSPPYVMDERDDGRTWPWATTWAPGDEDDGFLPCPYGEPGDLLWVREAHCVAHRGTWDAPKVVHPDGERAAYFRSDWDRVHPRWSPSIHMPKWAARIWLRVTDVRVERVQDIAREGLDADRPYMEWARLWGNPWNWVVSFERVER